MSDGKSSERTLMTRYYWQCPNCQRSNHLDFLRYDDYTTICKHCGEKYEYQTLESVNCIHGVTI